MHPRALGHPQVGGDTAANMDFTNAIYSRFPLALAAIALITFLLLARAFRSVRSHSRQSS